MTDIAVAALLVGGARLVRLLLARALDSMLSSSESVSDALLARGYAKASRVELHAPSERSEVDPLSNLAALVALCTLITYFETN